jgi:hypothetical protein
LADFAMKESVQMQIDASRSNAEHDATQFGAIRDLMLEASTRGDWLTLAEIAASTEFGEASISAQLQHLRKPRFGHYRVEKRRRDLCTNGALSFSGADCVDTNVGFETLRQLGSPDDNEPQKVFGPWEYRVFTAHTVKSLETFDADDTISGLVDELTRSHNLGRSHDDAVSQSGMPPADGSMPPDGVSESCSAATSDFAACVADAVSFPAHADAANAHPYSCNAVNSGEGNSRAVVRTDAPNTSTQEVCDR